MRLRHHPPCKLGCGLARRYEEPPAERRTITTDSSLDDLDTATPSSSLSCHRPIAISGAAEEGRLAVDGGSKVWDTGPRCTAKTTERPIEQLGGGC